MTSINKSYIYTGTIRHRRFTPFNHFFSYPLFMAYLDLDSLSTTFNKSWFWNIDKPALVSFMRKDYHGDEKLDLVEAVKKTIFDKVGYRVKGPIRLLTHLRYLGYCFNPVSFYYCFDEQDSEVDIIMAEVTNTPWDERFSYIIKEKDKEGKYKNLFSEFDKELHVSPFWGMDHRYEWLFSQPNNRLMVNMKNFKDGDKVFDATLSMKRQPFTKKELSKQVIRFPFITLVVVFRIHWQAFKLWVKNAPFFVHPSKASLTKGN
mgnify:FL=1|tara:strand:+ start:2597 stop:3379 length:783 start_codon:yes stop_codon:yes gene_type:complete